MKYSLRSLMIVVTLICVALGAWAGRVEYLRRWAVYHERAAKHYEDERNREEEKYFTAKPRIPIPGFENIRAHFYHEEMAIAYRQAMHRPWIPFADPPECMELREKYPELNR